MINLSGKTVLVTGASSGIGKSVCKLLAKQGACVILIGRHELRLMEVYQSLDGEGHQFFISDISDFQEIDRITKSIIDKGIRISGFVHSAGIEKTLPFKSSTPSLFQEVFKINVFACFELARQLSQKSIIDVTGASFVFISSVMGKLGEQFKTIYCASKSSLISGSKAIALELASKRIRCNCILPGIVETEMVQELFDTIPPESKKKVIDSHPLGIGRPEDVAALVAFLLSDESRWITGAEFVIDGGYSMR